MGTRIHVNAKVHIAQKSGKRTECGKEVTEHMREANLVVLDVTKVGPRVTCTRCLQRVC